MVSLIDSRGALYTMRAMALGQFTTPLFMFMFIFGLTHADFPNPDVPFGDAGTAGVTFVSTSRVETRIKFLEERTTPTRIAIMNYEGDTFPPITDFEEGKTNEQLGAEGVKDPGDGLWYLVIKLPQDFENPSQKTYGFRVDTGIGSPGHLVALTIENINDNAPIINALESDCKVEENHPLSAAESNCTFSVLDRDGSAAKITYSVSNPSFGVEVIDTISDFTVTVALSNTGLDFEAFSLYILNIAATDSDGTGLVGTTSYVVQVQDEADTPPVWTSPIVPQTIPEGVATSVQVTAIDGDIGIDAMIGYELQNENSMYFSIDSTGLIQIEIIDRDTLDSGTFTFDVIAFEVDTPASRVSGSMTVIVEDVNDNVPTISATSLPMSISIPEATVMSLPLGIQVNDPDLGDFGQFDIKLEDISGNGWNELFLLIPNSGYRKASVDISVQNATALDFENLSMRQITLQLVVSEQKDSSRRDMQDIVINLTDRNDESPVFDSSDIYTINISENIKKDEVVTTVRATDADAGDVVTHSFSTTQKALLIDSVTGVITVKIDNAFDFERQTEMVVQVLAEDSAGHRSVAQLDITVDDVNDTPPTLDMPTTQPSVAENSLKGTPVIASISATDEDTDGRIVFSIDWDLSTATKQGAKVVDSTSFTSCIEIMTTYPDLADTRTATAELFVFDEKLNWETFDTLSLRIVATDENTAAEYSDTKFRSATLSIEILDENDEAPKFTEDSLTATWTVYEHSGTGQLIGTVVAIDRDGPGNNDVTYSIAPADPNLPDYLVMVDPIKGDLKVNLSGEITCDTIYGDKMKYDVTASDGMLQETIQISIGIIDTNDKFPQHTVTEFEYTIMENSPTGTNITTVGATDDDFTIPFHTVSYFIDGKEDARLADLFYLDDKTGLLEVRLNSASGAVLDRDAGTTFYEITIIFRDNYQQGSNSPVSNTNTTKIIVNLEDENDNAPVFPTVSGYLAEPLENVKAGSTIYANLYAADQDDADNARVEYSVLSYERLPGGSTPPLPDNMFTIETTDSKGNIKVTTDLQDLWGRYNLELKAEDFGPTGEQQSSTMVYMIHVVDLNDHAPVISYPVEGEAIRLKEEQSVDSPLFDKNNVEIPLFRATDVDSGENAVVRFEIVGNADAKDYFKIVNDFNGMPNVAQLQLQKELVPEAKLFQLEINATDNGVPDKLFHFVNITLVIVKTVDVEPQFTQRTWDVTFMENSPSETATLDEPAHDENNDHLPLGDPEWDAIYYYLIDDNSPGFQFFSLDKMSGTLTLTEALDREEYLSHTFYVLASNLPDKPTNIVADPNSLSQLVLNVKVGDEDDSAPEFESDLWSGGISTGDPNGKIIMTIVAADPDEAKEVTYLLLQETMIADPSLDQVKDNAFVLDPKSGQLVLNFNPDSRMSGYFEFTVSAADDVGGEGHTTNTTVKIFIITDANRVVFKFLNEISEVEFMKREMIEVFTRTIGYNCTVDAIIRATDSTGTVIDRDTDVTTHFIDTEANEPVDNSVITAIVTNRDTITEMKQEFLKLDPYALVLTDYDPGTSVPPQSYEDLLRIILIVVSVVLGTLLILLFAAFFIKTRSLNRRLEALSTTKFGSQDSGLNRVGMSAPGANKRAIEGSNPVWGEDIGARDYDNISQGSYDSDLIGVEENPEFNTTATQGHHVNAGYDAYDEVEPRASVNSMPSGVPEYHDGGGQAPRHSLNPLSNGGTLRGLSHQVSIDSQTSDDGTFAVDDNFTFANKNNSIPITDL